MSWLGEFMSLDTKAIIRPSFSTEIDLADIDILLKAHTRVLTIVKLLCKITVSK